MSKRKSIVTALADAFKVIDGTGIYTTKLSNNSYPYLKFWDEVQDFPAVFVSPGMERREYQLAGFAWGILHVCVRAYCYGEETAQTQLESLLGDLENCIDLNRQLVYDSTNQYTTTEILIDSITTDEGLLAPYAVGEINLQIRYQIM